MEKFFPSRSAFITLIACCLTVIIALGIRQTFGLFYFDFSTDLDITISQFGFAMGLQLFLWGAFSPLFGVITDKYGGNIAIFLGFLFFLLGVVLFYSGFNTGVYFVDVPTIPGTDQSAFDHKVADQLGYFKLDFLFL